jgi:gamma-glutamylcyclotransferase (GGCT)/AIG2-like uncharacterized protein YtfP
VPTSLPACVFAKACAHLFVYGSLVDPRCLDEVLGHVHAGERLRAQLAGYERLATGAFAYPFIVAAVDRRVDGVLVMDLSADDMQVLDRYEEIAAGMYRRELVEVEAWGCGLHTRRLQAHTYVAGPGLIASATR